MKRIESITVVMVSYNSGEEILRCLESLATAPSRRQLEIIVVDNASGDGSAELLSRQESLRLIANQVNVGYARAVNQGIRAGGGDAFLVLNPDITVQPDSIDTLADFLEAHHEVGLAGAKLLNEDGSLQHSCRSFYTFWTILLRRTPLGRLFPQSRALRRHLMLDFDHAASRRVDWVLGACMLVRREAVADVGPMDERFFLYFEDVDWCYRLGSHGWEVWYVPDALMHHVHKRASARSPFSRSLAAHIVSFIHYTEKWNPVSYLIKRYRDPLKAALLLLLDLIAVNAALATATAIRLGLSQLFEHTYFDLDAYKRVAIFFNLIAIGSFTVTGLYRGSRRRQPGEELFSLIKAALLAGVALMAATYLTHERVVSRSVILLSLPLLVLFSALLRAGLGRVHRVFLRYNFDLRRLLLVGTASEAEQLGRLVLAHPELGLDLVGRVTGHESEESGSLGPLSRLERISEDERIQEILFAPSASAPRAVAPTLLWCRRRNLDLRVISDLAGIMSQGASVEDFLGLPALSYRTQGFFRVQILLKRLIDLFVSLVALALTLLPGLVHLCFVRLRGGPGLVRMPVRGCDGRRIDFPLPVNAAGDRTRSDLFNPWAYLAVLRGQLSLVGPLPRRLDDDTSMPQDFHAMRPGLTGSWRRRDLSRRRESLSNLDRLYYYNWGLAHDFQLWLGTLGEQLRGFFPSSFLQEERGPS